MSFWPLSAITDQLSKKTSVFGLRLGVLIAAVAAASLLLIFFLLSLCLSHRRRRRRRHYQQFHSTPPPPQKKQPKPLVQSPIPPISKQIPQIDEPAYEKVQQQQIQLTSASQIDVEKAESHGGEVVGGGGTHIGSPPEPGWGRRYSLRELEEATGGMAEEHVIGEGGYGVVYRGVIPDDGAVVAVKSLLNNK